MAKGPAVLGEVVLAEEPAAVGEVVVAEEPAAVGGVVLAEEPVAVGEVVVAEEPVAVGGVVVAEEAAAVGEVVVAEEAEEVTKPPAVMAAAEAEVVCQGPVDAACPESLPAALSALSATTTPASRRARTSHSAQVHPPRLAYAAQSDCSPTGTPIDLSAAAQASRQSTTKFSPPMPPLNSPGVELTDADFSRASSLCPSSSATDFAVF